jgi:hypothetical protein
MCKLFMRNPATKSQGEVGWRRVRVGGMGDGESQRKEQGAGDPSTGTVIGGRVVREGGLEHRGDQEESKRI